MIARKLQRALGAKGFTISKAAEVCGVDRTFLSRLLAGERPPRTREGRLTAEHDERYSNLARGLGLNAEEFVDIVVAEQRAAPTEKADEVDKQFRQTWDLVHKHIPLERKAETSKLVNALFSRAERPGDITKVDDEIMREVPAKENQGGSWSSETEPANTAYLHGSLLPNANTLMEKIAYELIQSGGPMSRSTRVELAALFYNLATRDLSRHWDRLMEIVNMR